LQFNIDRFRLFSDKWEPAKSRLQMPDSELRQHIKEANAFVISNSRL